MIQSMTGYGQTMEIFQGKKISIEIRTLNSKGIDLNVKAHSLLKEKEIEIRKQVSDALKRGKIEVIINLSEEEGSGQSINPSVFQAYYQQLKELASLTGEEPKDYFSLIVRMPDVLNSSDDVLKDDLWECIQNLLKQTLKKVEAFRNQEGNSLEKDFKERIKAIKDGLDKIAPFEKGRVDKVKERIFKNLEEAQIDVDKNRLEQELILYIEKLDISEEKVRLSNHLKFFLETLETKESQGKKLGFITQEIGREINTLGSKANHADMQKVVVEMKDELEKIKEQVLNIV